MTTKQILLSTLILSAAATNIALGMEKKTQDRGLIHRWDNTLNNEYITSALSYEFHTALNHVKIVRKLEENIFLAYDTIGNLKKDDSIFYDNRKNISKYIDRNNAVTCGNDTIILNSTDINDCNRLRDGYEEFKALTLLARKK